MGAQPTSSSAPQTESGPASPAQPSVPGEQTATNPPASFPAVEED